MEQCEGSNEDIISWCTYCKEIIGEGEGRIRVGDNYYHFDLINPYKNCYYPENEEISER